MFLLFLLDSRGFNFYFRWCLVSYGCFIFLFYSNWCVRKFAAYSAPALMSCRSIYFMRSFFRGNVNKCFVRLRIWDNLSVLERFVKLFAIKSCDLQLKLQNLEQSKPNLIFKQSPRDNFVRSLICPSWASKSSINHFWWANLWWIVVSTENCLPFFFPPLSSRKTTQNPKIFQVFNWI